MVLCFATAPATGTLAADRLPWTNEVVGRHMLLRPSVIVLPFYWERTVHMLCLPRTLSSEAKIAARGAFAVQCTDWQ